MKLLEDCRIAIELSPRGWQASYPTPCSCGGPCAGYRSRSSCPSLLVLAATLVKASKELPTCVVEGEAA